MSGGDILFMAQHQHTFAVDVYLSNYSPKKCRKVQKNENGILGFRIFAAEKARANVKTIKKLE